MKNYIFSLLVLSSLTGCSTVQIASLATIAFTGKGFGDHALSAVTGHDCAFFNMVRGERVCIYENSSEMLLLTNNQEIDTTTKAMGLEGIFSANFLVIGSFSSQENAESFKTAYQQWNSRVISSPGPVTYHRVLIGPIEQDKLKTTKQTLVKHGVQSPWLILL